jgi:predicted TIM-barrel fold metal-dependent hydrolase
MKSVSMQLNPTRRALLRDLGALGVGMLSAFAARAGASPAPVAAGIGWIDVHHHYLPPKYVAAVGSAAIGAPAGSKAAPGWSAESSLSAMDHNGVATALLSITAPGLAVQGAKTRQRLARSCNEYAAQLAADYPRRFGVFAVLPLPDVRSSLVEITHTLDTLHCDGVGLLTDYDGHYLGDPAFSPLMDELNRRRAVVFVHPTTCQGCADVASNVTASVIEFPHDTTRTIISLVTSGTVARCPDIRFIFSHAGGTLPFLVHRIANAVGRNPKFASAVPNGFIPAIQGLCYDTAGSMNEIAIPALLKLVNSSQLLFGSDFPFTSDPAFSAAVQGLGQLNLNDADKAAISRGNALRLFPRLI